MKTVLFNGEFLAEQEARIGIDDGGWLHGAGLFETMPARNGKVFRLEAHLDRLIRSTGLILAPIHREHLPSPGDLQKLLERNELRDARVRLTVTAGSVQEDSDPADRRLTVCATAHPLSTYPAQLYETGIQVCICDYRQSRTDPTAGHKTTSYLPRLLGMRAARAARCMESLWFNTDNQLAEGSITNVLLMRKGVLKTPPLNTPVLPGIARGLALQLAKDEGIEAQECPLNVDDLLDAEEVMLSNAIMGIMPVVRVEKRDIGDGRVGPMARKLRELYEGTVRKECEIG